MNCKKLSCKCHLIFKKITTPRPAHKLRCNIYRKLHLSKKYAKKKIEIACGPRHNFQHAMWPPEAREFDTPALSTVTSV